MIIWGSVGLKKTVGQGQFYCPQCSAPSAFDEIDVNNFFTLYFIPLIPLGKSGSFIKCKQCSGTFATEVKNYDPVVEKARTTENIRQMCVLILNDMNRCKPDELLALCDELGDVAGIDIEPEAVAADVLHAQQSDVDVSKYLKKNGADYSEQGKWLVLLIVRKVLEHGSGIDPIIKEHLYSVGKSLGLKKKHLEEFLESPLPKD